MMHPWAMPEHTRETKHWKGDALFGHKKMVRMAVGGRTTGKTTRGLIYIFRQFALYGHRACYMARSRVYLETLAGDGGLFANWKFTPNCEVKSDTEGVYVREVGTDVWLLLMYWHPLSSSSKLAPTDPFIKIIVLEEFLPAPGERYLKNEPERFMAALCTINRDNRDVVILMWANNSSPASPYYSYFGVEYPDKGKIYVGDHCALENCDNTDYFEGVKNSGWGAFVESTKYGKHALENAALFDEVSLVEARSKSSSCVARLLFQDSDIFVWRVNGDINLSLTGDPSAPSIAMVKDRATSGVRFEAFSNSRMMGLLKFSLRNGRLRFTDVKTKAAFLAAGVAIF